MSQLKNAIVVSLLFGAFFAVALSFTVGLVPGLIGGAIAGLAFGLLGYLFITSKVVSDQVKIGADGNEIIYAGRANHYINGEAAGGKLYLLKDKLTFKSHGFNLQNHQLDIPLELISAVKFTNTMGIIPNGLIVEIKEGGWEQFVVTDRKAWKAQIEAVIQPQ